LPKAYFKINFQEAYTLKVTACVIRPIRLLAIEHVGVTEAPDSNLCWVLCYLTGTYFWNYLEFPCEYL